MPDKCPFCGAALLDPPAPACPACGKPQAAAGLTRRVEDAGPRFTISEPGQPKVTVLLSQALSRIGREPSNEIVVQHPSVSRRHAQVEQREDGFWLTDLASRNGTSVNGKRLQPNHPVKLKDDDIIRIGDQHGNSVSLLFDTELTPAARRRPIHLDRVRDVAGMASFTLGRDPSNQVHLDHPSVSRVHARIDQTAHGRVLADLGSTNGTYLNGRRLLKPASIKAGDAIRIGPFKLTYDGEGLARQGAEGNYRLDGVGLKRAVSARFLSRSRSRRLILNDVSLSIYPREFVALVGGSGAGKSTLLKALSGFVPAEGKVLINGDDLYENHDAYESVLGYVPQDDIIHTRLVVRDALVYAAQLRLPDATPEEIAARVDEALEDVEMTAHAGKQVSRLSGGQRKRVSIAVELLAGPGLFFLDEPTSGLDPGLEKKMMYTLRKLADGGRTVVLVTHATANIGQCTHVAFMADGRLVFFGPPQDALEFFGTTDFADIYTRLTQPLDPAHNPPPPGWQAPPGTKPSAAEAWEACFRSSSEYQEHVACRLEEAGSGLQMTKAVRGRRTRPHVSLLRQFSVLSRRYFNLLRHDRMSLFVLLAVMPMIGLLLLLMAHETDLVGKSAPLVQDYVTAFQAQRLMFMLALAANLLGIFAASYEIIKEDAVYRRERMVTLRIFPYLLSKIVVLGVFSLVQCALLLLVLRLKVRYPTDGLILPPVAEIYLTLVLTALASLSMGLLISAVVRSSDMVVYVILIVLFVQIIFAGAIFPLDDSVKAITDLSTTHWSLQALGSIINLPAQGFYVDYQHDLDHVLQPWGILAGFAVACTALAALAQKRKDAV